MTEKPLLAWTDYPFLSLGDAPNMPAPLRQVSLLAYDGNKYVTIEVAGKIEEVKAGYLYSRCARDAPSIGKDILSKLGAYP